MNSFFRGVAAALALCAAPALAQDLDDSKDNVAGPYVPTPRVIVEEMLKLADIRGEDVVGGETFVKGGETEEAFGQESGDEEEGGAGEDLGSDEPAAEKAAAACAGGAAGVLQGLERLDAKKTKRGKEAEDEDCAYGDED